jgi:hypothetical protein
MLALMFTFSHFAAGQRITEDIPNKIDPEAIYVFYLHGGIIENQGVNAVSQYYGPYLYLNILDSLAKHGFHVISEARPKETDQLTYANKVMTQIHDLKKAGVPVNAITIVGASLGAYITMEIANLMQEPQLNYVLLGLCSPYAIGLYQKYNHHLKGDFLSIYERKDEKSSCAGIFDKQVQVTSYQEIQLTMDNGHAFLYRPYDEWVLPLISWINR